MVKRIFNEGSSNVYTDVRIYDEEISKIPVKVAYDLLEVSQNLTKAELEQWLSDVTGYEVKLNAKKK